MALLTIAVADVRVVNAEMSTSILPRLVKPLPLGNTFVFQPQVSLSWAMQALLVKLAMVSSLKNPPLSAKL